MKYKFLVLISLAVILSGCASGYTSRGLFCGGYSEIRTNPDSFIVTYNGNGYTHADDAMRYVLLRASELTLQNGYRYFAILATADQTSSYNYSDTYDHATGSLHSHRHSNCSHTQLTGSSSSSTYSGKVVKPGVTIRIKCFNDQSQFDDAIDAQFYWDANQPA